jgi:hypothetical protein
MLAMEAENRTWNEWSRSLSSMLDVASLWHKAWKAGGLEARAQYAEQDEVMAHAQPLPTHPAATSSMLQVACSWQPILLLLLCSSPSRGLVSQGRSGGLAGKAGQSLEAAGAARIVYVLISQTRFLCLPEVYVDYTVAPR